MGKNFASIIMVTFEITSNHREEAYSVIKLLVFISVVLVPFLFLTHSFLLIDGTVEFCFIGISAFYIENINFLHLLILKRWAYAKIMSDFA